jgi:hypothetical protein
MRMKKLQDAGIDDVFFLKKSCRNMYTIFSAVQRQQRKSDVMTYFGVTACSAVYYHAGSSLVEVAVKTTSAIARTSNINSPNIGPSSCDRSIEDLCWTGKFLQ